MSDDFKRFLAAALLPVPLDVTDADSEAIRATRRTETGRTAKMSPTAQRRLASILDVLRITVKIRLSPPEEWKPLYPRGDGK